MKERQTGVFTIATSASPIPPEHSAQHVVPLARAIHPEAPVALALDEAAVQLVFRKRGIPEVGIEVKASSDPSVGVQPAIQVMRAHILTFMADSQGG